MRRVLKPEGKVLIMEDTEHSGFFSRLMHAVDRGGYIRTGAEWEELMASEFTIREHSTFLSGMGCFYSAFTLTNEKKN